jgi:hypothetical protein
MALALKRNTDLEEAAVLYDDAGMAAGGNLTGEYMNLGRTEGLPGLVLPPLSAPVPRKSSAGLSRRALPDEAKGGDQGLGRTYLVHSTWCFSLSQVLPPHDNLPIGVQTSWKTIPPLFALCTPQEWRISKNSKSHFSITLFLLSFVSSMSPAKSTAMSPTYFAMIKALRRLWFVTRNPSYTRTEV